MVQQALRGQANINAFITQGDHHGCSALIFATMLGYYDELVVRGRQSLAEAIEVGGAIEEIDILDLKTRLAETDNADIQRLYNSLMNGSYNHLNAFANAPLQQTGETYQPQFLSTEAYQAIATTQPGNRNGGGQGGSGQQGGQGSCS